MTFTAFLNFSNSLLMVLPLSAHGHGDNSHANLLSEQWTRRQNRETLRPQEGQLQSPAYTIASQSYIHRSRVRYANSQGSYFCLVEFETSSGKYDKTKNHHFYDMVDVS